MTKLLISSYNDSKIKEFRSVLAILNFNTVSAKELNLPDVEETGATFEENALLKARAGAKATGFITLADDSGLELPELDHYPGVVTARFAKSAGGYEKATRELLNRAGKEETKAQYRCVLAFVYPNGEEIVAQGIVTGKLVWPKRAESEFGFDPWFLPDGEDRVFAQMTLEEKQKISHRGRAFEDLLKKIKGTDGLRAVS